MISQGLLQNSQKKEQKGPECPSIFIGTLEKYRDLKFVQRDDGETIINYPRDMLGWHHLDAYRRVSGQPLTMLESELIMGIDGVFEGRDDG